MKHMFSAALFAGIVGIGAAAGLSVATAEAAPAFCSTHEDQSISPSEHVGGSIYKAACGPSNTGNGGCDDMGPGCTKHDSNSGGTDDNVPPGSGIN